MCVLLRATELEEASQARRSCGGGGLVVWMLEDKGPRGVVQACIYNGTVVAAAAKAQR